MVCGSAETGPSDTASCQLPVYGGLIHALALIQNSYGELGHGDTATRPLPAQVSAVAHHELVDVAAGNEHTVVLSADGTLHSCGYNDRYESGEPAWLVLTNLS
jgi:alpha-tubulin suppressor-like RCC1 family protein